jgi:nucleosome binding factor SPN SPT16 subunit
VGSTLSHVYNSTRQFIESKNPEFLSRISSNFGYGIGLTPKEDMLSING